MGKWDANLTALSKVSRPDVVELLGHGGTCAGRRERRKAGRNRLDGQPFVDARELFDDASPVAHKRGELPATSSQPAMKRATGFIQWAAPLTALTVFALVVATIWELPHYETLVGLPQSRHNRAWLLGVLWAKTLLPVGVVFLGCATFGRSRYRRWASRSFWGATGLILTWLLADLWCQLRYGAEASSYLPFVVAALRGGATEKHIQWVGNAGAVAASLITWLALWALAFACLLIASRYGWSTLAARTSSETGAKVSRAWLGLWCIAVLATSFGIQQLEPRPVSESLAFYLPFPFGFPFDRLVSRDATDSCQGPTLLGAVPESWQGDHRPQLVFRNACSRALSLAGWSYETHITPRTPLAGSIEPGELLSVPLAPDAVTPAGTQVVRLRTPDGQISGRLKFRREEIKRGEMVANPAAETASMRRIEAAAQRAYRHRFAGVRSLRPLPEFAPRSVRRRPNLVLLVMDSFRADVVTPALMPRLAGRSGQGIRALRHYAGSNSSHLGLFALLYGRSPLAYDTVLDAPRGDHAAELFRRLGYRTFFLSSGGIEAWKRMDEYLNREIFDELQLFRAASGQVWRDWPQNDRRLLDATRGYLESASQPVFIVAFLMSLHFPYPYPAAYQRFQPVSHEDRILDWKSLFAARLDRTKLWNRYRNAAGAVDAMLEAFLESIDLAETVVVITGDHGESFGEDGTFVHGSRPSDVQTQVPLFVLGGGVAAREITGPTSHVDVLPTLARIASGASRTELGFQGRDLNGPIGEEPILLRLYRLAEPAPVLIIHGDQRLLLRARTDLPEIDAVGFVDPTGTPITDGERKDEGRWTVIVQRALAGVSGSAASE